jgi:uncharacterized OB-fold protein
MVPASGRGRVYSFTVMRVATPYAPAMVELEEGPRIFTNIVDGDFAEIHIGMAVRLVWKPTRGRGPARADVRAGLSFSGRPAVPG